MWLELRLSIRCEHEFVEELGIKEAWIGLTGPRPIAGLLGIARNRDLFPHLEAHLEVFGNLVQITPELVGCWRSVEGRVITDGPKQRLPLVLILTIFSQTLSGKRALGVLPRIDLALPAFIRPG